MKKKECPSCAMEIDASSRRCPVCNYEFPSSNGNAGLKLAALLLALLFLFYLISL